MDDEEELQQQRWIAKWTQRRNLRTSSESTPNTSTSGNQAHPVTFNQPPQTTHTPQVHPTPHLSITHPTTSSPSSISSSTASSSSSTPFAASTSTPTTHSPFASSSSISPSITSASISATSHRWASSRTTTGISGHSTSPRPSKVEAWPPPRSGHTMAYCLPPHGQTPFVALFGGYDLHYHNDLWILPVGEVAVPSLLNMCGQSLRNRPALLARHYQWLPEELRQKLAVCWVPARHERWVFVEAANRFRFTMPKRTTAGMRYLEGRLWLWGGSEGSPTNNDIYCFDFSKREWIKVEATGQRPKATNYVQMTTMGSKLIILSHLTMPYIYFFDTNELHWTAKRLATPIATGDEGAIGIAHGRLYQMAANCEGVHVLTNLDEDEEEKERRLQMKRILLAQRNTDGADSGGIHPKSLGEDEREITKFVETLELGSVPAAALAGSLRLSGGGVSSESSSGAVYDDDEEDAPVVWYRLRFEQWSHRIYVTGICFIEDRLYFLSGGHEIYVSLLPASPIAQTLSAHKLTLFGDDFSVAGSGVTLCGYRRLLIVFGGCGGQYFDTTYAIYVSADYDTAQVVNLKSIKGD